MRKDGESLLRSGYPTSTVDMKRGSPVNRDCMLPLYSKYDEPIP